MKVESYIENLPALDWSDEESAHRTATNIFLNLASNTDLLDTLVAHRINEPKLRRMHECHIFDDKIILLDELKSKGMHIRFRLAKATHFERVHNHHFPSVHLILHGAYQHTLYKVKQAKDGSIQPDSITPLAIKHELQGSALLVGSHAFHTTLIEEATISLLLRGPIFRGKAAQFDVTTSTALWQEGAAQESADRRASVYMSDCLLQNWLEFLKKMEIL